MLTVKEENFLDILANSYEFVNYTNKKIKYRTKPDIVNIHNQQICVICFENLIHKNKKSKSTSINHCTQLSCIHCFHFQCINQWFKIKKSCPVCRKIFRNDKKKEKYTINLSSSHLINITEPITHSWWTFTNGRYVRNTSPRINPRMEQLFFEIIVPFE